MIKAERRVKIGSGVSGPGTALWVEAEDLPETAHDTEEVRKLATEYKGLVIATLQRRDAWQVIDTVNRVTDPSTLADLAGYAPWLSDERKRELLETPMSSNGGALIEWTKAYIAETEVNEKIADDVREGMEKSQREFLLRQQLNAIRKELGEDEPDGAEDYRARVEAADLPMRCARPHSVRLASSSGPATRVLSLAGSAPGWTSSSSCPGPPRPPTRPTSTPHARCWTPTTTALRTSRIGSWSTSRFVPAARSATGGCRRSWLGRCDGLGRPRLVWARHRWASRSPGRWGASSCASPLVAYATKLRSAVTGAPMSALFRDGSFVPSPRPGR